MHIRPFEIALIGFFAIAGLVGLFVLSSHQSDSEKQAKLFGESIIMWGTLDGKIVNDFLFQLSDKEKALQVVTYKQIDARSFDSEILNAIANGQSPDLLILPHELLVSYRARLQSISYEALPVRTFKDTYIDGAEIFMLSDGVYGIPFAVDPLMMYWNRDIFSSSGLATPPKTWETLVTQTTNTIVRKDDSGTIAQSAVAFGEYTNVTHAKKILSMLFMQAGSSIVEESNKYYTVTLNKGSENALTPGDAVLSFYTQFALPKSSQYSWNRAKLFDRIEFVNGSLGLYFAPGSERASLERENANLNFDIAAVPQGSGATTLRDYGDFYAFSMPRASKNIAGAYALANYLASPTNAKILADRLGFAPVHRTLYEVPESDTFKKSIFQSALIARGWLDPSPAASGNVFRSAVEEVTSGRTRLSNVIIDTVHSLESLF